MIIRAKRPEALQMSKAFTRGRQILSKVDLLPERSISATLQTWSRLKGWPRSMMPVTRLTEGA